MNYEKILLELLSRIQTLEEKVSALEAGSERAPAPEKGQKVSTEDIRAYIERCKHAAADRGDTSVIMQSGEIHRAMNLVSRMPQVCNAMRQCMRENDKVLFETPSGYSSTLKIQYNLEEA